MCKGSLMGVEMKRVALFIMVLLLFMVLGCTTTTQAIPPSPVVEPAPAPVQEAEPFRASSMLGKLDESGFEQLVDQRTKAISVTPAKTVETAVIPPAPIEEPAVIEPAPVRVEAVPVPEPVTPYKEERPVVQKTEPKETIPEGLVFKAVGTGLTESEARSDALAALSGILYSKVSSTIETKDKVNEIAGIEVANASSFSEHTLVSTDLPILGASFSLLPRTVYDAQRKAYLKQVEAVMAGSVSLPLYEGELTTLAAVIRSAERDYPSSADSLSQESALQRLLDAYLEFERLSYVARALGSKTIPTLMQTSYSVEAQLRQMEKVVDSYAKAARNLTKGLDKTGVYVYPAKLNNSGGVTEFAEQLAFSMGEALGAKAVSDPKRASHFLFGSYTLVDDGKSGMYVTYRLEDQKGNTVTTTAAEIPPSVYQGQRFIPIAYDFEKQLERGDSVDTGFSVDIRMNGMKDYLSFHRGDELTIEVKASEPCYFYVVGYVFNELDEKFAYLFPLSLDASGKNMFVRRVSPEEVNRWIIINPIYRGKVMPIEVIEPFGVEMLQVYASTERDYQKFLDSVPGFRTTRDYYLVSDNPEEGLRLTRALNIKRVSEEASSEIKRSEAFVSFKSGR